jgi:ribonucleoside-diphosphate reductase alpha chain
MYLRPSFDYQELARRVAVLVINMNQIIDKNYYPTPETEISNKRHRPIGIGVQGLADLFCEMGMAFDSDDAKFLQKKIFETIYFTALSTSNRLARDMGKTYDSYEGSPLSQGIFHYELCHNFEKQILVTDPVYDWESLRSDILADGVRNSLFVAPMPTASTSQILYQNECFEPFTSNLYVRRTLAGEFTIFNKYMVQDLRDIGLWNQETIDHLIVHKGSIQNLMEVPKSIRLVYRTAWEISQKSLIDMAVHRQWFIDQSQSFNLFMSDPSLDKLTKMHFYGWKNGLKTGSYYIRTKPQHFSQNFTVDPKKEDEICTSCSA